MLMQNGAAKEAQLLHDAARRRNRGGRNGSDQNKAGERDAYEALNDATWMQASGQAKEPDHVTKKITRAAMLAWRAVADRPFRDSGWLLLAPMRQ